MIRYVKGDLFAHIADFEAPFVIAHVCNDVGAWGAGFSGALGEKYPRARENFLAAAQRPRLGQTSWACEFFLARRPRLGQTIWACDGNAYIGNMVAQTGVGKATRPLRYWALAQCMRDVALFAVDTQSPAHVLPIHAPMFGAGLAGGDWGVIAALIEDTWCREGIDVTIYHLEDLP